MSTDSFAAKLDSLDYVMPDWCLKPSEKRVAAYEAQFNLHLPADYRDFLVRFGGIKGESVCAFEEPTPYGPQACIEDFYGFMPADRRSLDVRWTTEMIDRFPDVVAIAQGGMGTMIWLKCTGGDIGSVYMHDVEQRALWPDKMFHDQFEALSPDIIKYLDLRRRGKLPSKPQGYENVYSIATSFSQFIDKLQAF